jgi:hypothetical protein
VVPSFMQDWLEKEAYKHPVFFLVAIISMGMMGGMWFNPFVMADDFHSFQENSEQRLGKLEVAVCTVQNTIEKTSLEAQLRDVSTEIFQLERIVSAHEATPRDIDRLDDLRNEKEALDRRIEEYLGLPLCVPDHGGAAHH